MVFEGLVSTCNTRLVEPSGPTPHPPLVPEAHHAIRHAICRWSRPPAPAQRTGQASALGRRSGKHNRDHGRAAPVCLRALPVPQCPDQSGDRADVGRSGAPEAYRVERLAISFRGKYGPHLLSALRTTMGGLMHKTGDLMRNEMDG